MKTKIGILVLALSTSFVSLQAQRRVVTTTRATSYDISDNLDLDAIASIFGDSENLEDFERRMNDPDNRISNLDLNQDGYIDYLRVLENSDNRNSLVVVQAVLDEDVYQDVATIEIERVQNGNPRVQIVGDSYIYGSNYIIEPTFYRTPLIFSFFWGSHYRPWQSPYYWNYYPSWYSYYRPYSPFKYHRHIYTHINIHNKYHHTANRNIYFSGDNYNHIRKNDFATRYPERAFVNRHSDVSNKNELIERRSGNTVNRQIDNDIQQSNDRQYQGNMKSASSNEGQRNVNENRRPSSNVQSESNQTSTREINVETNKKRTDSSNESVKVKSDNRNEGNSVSRSRSTSTSTPDRPVNQVQTTKPSSDSPSRSVSKPTPDRSASRIESTRRSPVSTDKSVSVSRQSSSNTEVKQTPQSERKTESIRTEDKNETGNRRRR